MEQKTVCIRDIRTADLEPTRKIYEHYVLNSAATFNGVDEVPTNEAWYDKVQKTAYRYPWLVADCEGEVLGFAYAGPFRMRAAYAWDVETTIYIRPDARGFGIGRALYTQLEALLRSQHVRTMYACVTHTDRTDDPNLTDASEHFHEAMGFTVCGHMKRCGFKFGRWYDILWLEKKLVDDESAPEPFVRFPEA